MGEVRRLVGGLGRVVVITACLAPREGDAQATAASAPVAATACDVARAPRESFDMQIPFEVIDGRIYVQVRVNGRGPFRFAVDTGASGLARADSSLVATLGLSIAPPVANSDGVATAAADTTAIDVLDVGGIVKRDLRVITRDYNRGMSPASALSGIVGREFFADGVLVIDYPRRLLSFGRTLALSPEAEGALRYQRPFRVPVRIGTQQVEGHLDTGANVTFVLPRALFDTVSNSPAEPMGEGRLSNTTVDTMRATVQGPFVIGDASLSGVDVRVSARFPELLVGAHALQSLVLVIDQRSRALAVCR